ncbi:hypothetical protein [Roseateles asaccharophilus]|uniref:hypothetical protein n=1 Tax=Roseateles asaccharophilus TaxID=582607 RepID=UPI00286A9AF9|nr:hypothetical protein [Roseateles asaccharophilus]
MDKLRPEQADGLFIGVAHFDAALDQELEPHEQSFGVGAYRVTCPASATQRAIRQEQGGLPQRQASVQDDSYYGEKVEPGNQPEGQRSSCLCSDVSR